MSKIRLVVSSIILSSASALSWAQATDDHNVHHPDATAPNPAATPVQSNSTDNASLVQKMDEHMKAMHEFHEKFSKSSPDERQTLMSEHQRLMQEGMRMMRMASGGPQGMRMMSKMRSQPGKGQPMAECDLEHSMMSKRMDMMQSMMEMMMDRAPAATPPAR